MARTPQDLGKGQVGITATTLFISDPATNTILRRLTFYNTSTSNVLVSVYKVRSGASAGDAGTQVAEKTIAAGRSWVCFEVEGHVFPASGTLEAIAGTASVIDYNVSGTAVS